MGPQKTGYLGGGFKYCFIFTPIGGRFPFWLIFSNGFKPPTSYVCRAFWHSTYKAYITPVKAHLFCGQFVGGLLYNDRRRRAEHFLPRFKLPSETQVHDYAKSLSYNSFDDQAGSFFLHCRGCPGNHLIKWQNGFPIFFGNQRIEIYGNFGGFPL